MSTLPSHTNGNKASLKWIYSFKCPWVPKDETFVSSLVLGPCLFKCTPLFFVKSVSLKKILKEASD